MRLVKIEARKMLAFGLNKASLHRLGSFLVVKMSCLGCVLPLAGEAFPLPAGEITEWKAPKSPRQ